jgi:Protein of unknown function (DUF2934)
MSDNHDMTRREERIRQRAYELWEAAGRPGNDHEKFWLLAEAELAAEETPEDDRTIPRRKEP